MKKFDRDLMNGADMRQVCRASMHIIDTMQNYTPEVQQLALAATTRMLSEHRNLNINDMFVVLGNMMAEAQAKGKAEFRAVRRYIKEEIA